MLEQFLDVRQIQERLEDAGIEITTPINPEAGDRGPASLALTVSDGNQVLIDQVF